MVPRIQKAGVVAHEANQAGPRLIPSAVRGEAEVEGSSGVRSEGINNGEFILGMSFEEALEIWSKEGKPIIHLRPGENCFDLEKLLSHRDVKDEHLLAVRRWLKENVSPIWRLRMPKKIEVMRPGVVDRLRTARTAKHCSLCGRPINPGESYWQRKRSWRRCAVPVSERCGYQPLR